MPRAKSQSGRETALVAELRSAIDDSGASYYALAKKSGIDVSAVRKFVTRERSLTIDSAGRIAEALGLKLTRPAKPRKFVKLPRATRKAAPADGRSVFEVVGDRAEDGTPKFSNLEEASIDHFESRIRPWVQVLANSLPVEPGAHEDAPPRPDPGRGGAEVHQEVGPIEAPPVGSETRDGGADSVGCGGAVVPPGNLEGP